MIRIFNTRLACKSRITPLYLPSTFTQTSSYYHISHSSTTPLSPPGTEKLFHKDWLSPAEVVKIFHSAEPSSVLSLYNHVSRRKDYKPNEALYTVIIDKLGQDKNFDGVDNIMNMIRERRHCRLSDGFFYGVMKVYGNAGGLVDRVIETLFDIPGYDCWPSVKTFNFVLNLLVSTKKYDVVPRVYMSASSLCVEIDACTLNILIKGLCERGALNDALKVLDEFPKQGCRPNKLTFSTIMHCMCEKGMVDEAFELIGRMEMEGVSPDSVTFNILVSGLQKQGRVEEAMELLDRMKIKGCEPNKGTYQEVLYGLLRAKRFVDASAFVHRMRLKSMIPSYSSYKLLVLGLCREDLLGDVEWVLNSMVDVGFVPRMGMWKKVVEKMFSRRDAGVDFTEIARD